MQNFSEIQKKAYLRLLKMHYEAGVGHIGGNLSALDCLLYLHHNILHSNDQFVLSKGHSAGALYIALWSIGKISEEQITTFHANNTKLSAHPAPNFLPEIPFATGSLGHGVGLACGLALGNKLRKKNGRVFCLTSDGEWQEGSNFESLIFLNHHQLNNLSILVDCNGLQGFGNTEEVASLNSEKLKNIFSNFDCDVQTINGHNAQDLAKINSTSNRPQIFLLNTIKGNRISFMENQMQWHYLPLTKELYEKATIEIMGK